MTATPPNGDSAHMQHVSPFVKSAMMLETAKIREAQYEKRIQELTANLLTEAKSAEGLRAELSHVQERSAEFQAENEKLVDEKESVRLNYATEVAGLRDENRKLKEDWEAASFELNQIRPQLRDKIQHADELLRLQFKLESAETDRDTATAALKEYKQTATSTLEESKRTAAAALEEYKETATAALEESKRKESELFKKLESVTVSEQSHTEAIFKLKHTLQSAESERNKATSALEEAKRQEFDMYKNLESITLSEQSYQLKLEAAEAERNKLAATLEESKRKESEVSKRLESMTASEQSHKEAMFELKHTQESIESERDKLAAALEESKWKESQASEKLESVKVSEQSFKEEMLKLKHALESAEHERDRATVGLEQSQVREAQIAKNMEAITSSLEKESKAATDARDQMEQVPPYRRVYPGPCQSMRLCAIRRMCALRHTPHVCPAHTTLPPSLQIPITQYSPHPQMSQVMRSADLRSMVLCRASQPSLPAHNMPKWRHDKLSSV